MTQEKWKAEVNAAIRAAFVGPAPRRPDPDPLYSAVAKLDAAISRLVALRTLIRGSLPDRAAEDQMVGVDYDLESAEQKLRAAYQIIQRALAADVTP